MSKRRDALRRGIRDLIEDTSRDLVAFEGREPRPRPAAPPGSEGDARASRGLVPEGGDARASRGLVQERGDTGASHDAPALNGGPLDAADRSAAPAEAPAAPPAPTGTLADHEGDAGPRTEEPLAAHRPSGAPPKPSPPGDRLTPDSPATTTSHPAEPVRPVPRPPLDLTMPPAFVRPVPLPADRLTPGPPATATPRPADGPGVDERPQARAAAKKPKTSRARRAAASRGRTPPPPRSAPAAPADDVVTEDVGPAPAESRTGVCRSYFINHECWRVSAAYCNTALQVCVIRNCPVYHLHKDALERRFAKKFKHFW